MTEFEKVGVLSDRASDNVQLDSDKDNEDSQSSLQPVLGKGEPTMSKSTGLADSWDMIETPRTARTDSDIAPTEVKVAESFPPKGIESQGLPSAKKQYKKYARKEKKHGSTHPARSRHARKAVEDRSDETHGRQHRSGMHSDFSKSENDLRTSNCNENKPPRARPRSANSSHRDIPRASRRMKIRTHEDMLQEHYAELSVLLNDQANLSREKLREHHYVQTKRMMEDYKELNNGMSPRGILVSRSLPESLRSPRSHSNTPRESPARRQRSLSDTKSVSPPPARKSSTPKSEKHVSFKSASNSSIGSGPKTLTEELERRSRSRAVKPKYDYVKQPKNSKPRKTKIVEPQIERYEPAPQPEVKPGIIEDWTGTKYSDCSLKNTNNTKIHDWLKEKERMIRKEKKSKREQEKQKKVKKEAERQKSEERQAQAQLSMKEWQAKVRKRSKLLLKRQKQEAKSLLGEMGETPTPIQSAAPTTTNMKVRKLRPKSAKQPQVDNNISQPPKTMTAPQRPKSAPSIRAVKSSPISINTLIDNDPELKGKLRELERQKKLKHRQPYDQWVKEKAQEKRDTLRLIREQRLKLEKEISEETARVISESARRRIDNIRYKRTASPTTENQSRRNETGSETRGATSHPQPKYTWSQETRENSNKPTPPKTRSASATSDAKTHTGRSTKPQAPGKTEVEDKVCPDSTNPYSYKPPKLRRPKSRLEQGGINGPEFSRFIYDLVNEEEAKGSRPEPQGADSPTRMTEKPSKPHPPMREHDSAESPRAKSTEPIIQGKSIFSMTSIE